MSGNDEQQESRFVIVRVTNLSVAKNYKDVALAVEPVGDMLYAIPVPPACFSDIGELEVLDLGGIRHVFRGLAVALSIDVEENDF